MKQLILLVTVALLLTVCVVLMPMEAKAAEVASGTCGADGDNLTWTLDDTGTLTISGTGEMKDTSPFLGSLWSDHRSEIKHVVINEGVTVIGRSSFHACENLTNVTIADSVTEIRSGAFANNPNLTSVTLPNNLKTIGREAFWCCSGLTSITIPGSVEKFDYAFYECSSLTSVTILEGVEEIGESAFSKCINLTEVTLPNSVAYISIGAFNNCTALTSITFPGQRIGIELYAFRYCSNLKIIRFLGEEVSVGGLAFDDIPLWHVLYAGKEENWTSNLDYLEKKLDIDITYHYSCAEGDDPITCTVTKPATCIAQGQMTYSCTICNTSIEVAIPKTTTHRYDNDCDPDCADCGMTREIEHSYSTEWKSDRTNHWHECTICTIKSDEAAHKFSDEAAETSSPICTVCGYDLSAKPEQQETGFPAGVIVTVAIVVLGSGGAAIGIVLWKKKH